MVHGHISVKALLLLLLSVVVIFTRTSALATMAKDYFFPEQSPWAINILIS